MIRIFGYIWAVVKALCIILTMLLWLFYYALTTPILGDSTRRAFALRRHWLKYIGVPFLNIHIEVKGQPIEGAALYVCNHRSFADPIVLCRYLDAFVIAKAEVASYPVINWGAKKTGVLYVKRENKDSRNAVREKMVETIKSGHNVLVYPEGTIGLHRHTLPFKTGTFLEAADNGLKIVPVAIEYMHDSDLWRHHNFLVQFVTQFSKWRLNVKLHFGEVLESADGTWLKDQSEQWINQELEVMQRDWTKINFVEAS